MSKFQTSSMTPALFNKFFPENVVNFVSPRSIDFGLYNLDKPFTEIQKIFLRNGLGIESEDVINIKQVHGNNVLSVLDRDASVQEADGIVTNIKNCPIVIRTADCLPVFLYDSDAEVIGLVHAGWRGTHKNIVGVAISKMVDEFGVQRENIRAAFGPCISSDNYEVGAEFTEYFPDSIVVSNGKYYLDIGAANKRQLLDARLKPNNIFDCGICTYANSDYFSYRREGRKSGRILSLMMIKS